MQFISFFNCYNLLIQVCFLKERKQLVAKKEFFDSIIDPFFISIKVEIKELSSSIRNCDE